MDKISWISYSRVVATIFILLCHIISYYPMVPGYQILPDFFNMGVEIFIIISGWLFGSKNAHSGKSVDGISLGRFLKISLPSWILALTVLTFVGWSELRSVVICLLDLQGLSFITDYLHFLYGGQYLAHTWFVTVILMCYCIIPFIHRLVDKESPIAIIGIIWLACTIAAYCGLSLFYFAIFATAYFLGYKMGNKQLRVYQTCLMFIGAVVLRLFVRYFFDGTIFYNKVIVFYSHTLMAFSIVYFMKYLASRLPDLTGNKVIGFIEKYSYEIYLVHFPIIPYIYSTGNLGLATFAFIVLTLVLSVILHHVTKYLYNRILKRINANI